MEIYYQGVNITRYVQVRKCVVRDVGGGRCDSLEIEFENAAGWYRWGPEEDDKIIVAQNGYDTGIMYLNTILPEEGHYRIWASALPCAARKKENRSFTGKTIEDIMRACGMATGMQFALYGIDGNTKIPYIQQENESAASFLQRLMMWEGAALKCANGRYNAVSIAYAQDRPALRTVEITAKQRGAEYRRNGAKYRSVTIKTPYAQATAEDTLAPETHAKITLDLPARNNIQAGRWARGVLVNHNRQTETLQIESEFNPGFSAMARLDVLSATDAAGEWIVEEAEHDLYNKTSRAKLYRCIRTVK